MRAKSQANYVKSSSRAGIIEIAFPRLRFDVTPEIDSPMPPENGRSVGEIFRPVKSEESATDPRDNNLRCS